MRNNNSAPPTPPPADDDDIGAAGLAAVAAGALANPIVLWSEFTLKTTGAGLPPGPGGALGAAGNERDAVGGVCVLFVVCAFFVAGARSSRRHHHPAVRIAPGRARSSRTRSSGSLPPLWPRAACCARPAAAAATTKRPPIQTPTH